MKKFFKSLALIAVAAFGFASCEDVPAPYDLPTNPPTKPTVDTIYVTCEEALAIVDKMSDGETSAELYAITGYITDVFSTISKGQQSFWFASTADGGKQIQAYWANLPEGVASFKLGSKVKVVGKLMRFINSSTGALTPEMKNADVEILGGGDDPVDVVKKTCDEAAAIVAAMEDGATSSETYEITGYITDVFTNISKGQQTFWMADTKDGGKVIQAYWANLPEGVESFKKDAKVKITGKLLKYVKDGNVTPEVKNADVVILEEGGEQGGGGEQGTQVSCADAAAIAMALEDKASTAEDYTITGYITEVVGSVSKNQQTFWMADTKDGGKVFEAYWANLPEGVTEFKAGTKVKITGKIMRYGTTAEIKNANVEIIEEGQGGGGEQGGVISKNCADAAAIAMAMEDKATSEETYAVTGYITEVVGSVSKNQQTFWMADTKDGGKVFEAYWANLPEGVSEFVAGSKVKITGKIMRYGTTAEIKNADVEILEAGTQGGGTQGGGQGGDQGGDQGYGSADATLVMSSLYTITEGSVDAGSVSANGVTLTFDQNGGGNAPKYYWNATEAFRSVRMYAMNKMTIAADKMIAAVKVTCAAPSGSTLYNGNSTVIPSAGKLTKLSDNITIIVNDVNAKTFDITNEHTGTTGGVQLRVVSVEVNYVK